MAIRGVRIMSRRSRYCPFRGHSIITPSLAIFPNEEPEAIDEANAVSLLRKHVMCVCIFILGFSIEQLAHKWTGNPARRCRSSFWYLKVNKISKKDFGGNKTVKLAEEMIIVIYCVSTILLCDKKGSFYYLLLASPKWRDWDRTGKRMFPNARDGKFPGFFREKSGSREMAFGNADL